MRTGKLRSQYLSSGMPMVIGAEHRQGSRIRRTRMTSEDLDALHDLIDMGMTSPSVVRMMFRKTGKTISASSVYLHRDRKIESCVRCKGNHVEAA